MTRRPRRNHTPAFKARVALAAIKGDRTLAQLAEQFDVEGLHLGGGNDLIFGNSDSVNYFISGNGGTDTITTSGGDDIVAGGASADTLSTGAGNDAVLGGAGNDFIKAGDGQNLIVGGAGDDTIEAGVGNDIYFFNCGDGFDTITNMGGVDTLVFGPGITADDLVFEKAAGGTTVALKDVDKAVADLADKVFLKNWKLTANQVESIIFFDGSSLNAREIYGLAGGDVNTVGLGALGRTFIAGTEIATLGVDKDGKVGTIQNTNGDTFSFGAAAGDLLSVVSAGKEDDIRSRNYANATIDEYRYTGIAWQHLATETYGHVGQLTSRVEHAVTDPAFAGANDPRDYDDPVRERHSGADEIV